MPSAALTSQGEEAPARTETPPLAHCSAPAGGRKQWGNKFWPGGLSGAAGGGPNWPWTLLTTWHPNREVRETRWSGQLVASPSCALSEDSHLDDRTTVPVA
jgi:hypothetical protein